MSPHSHPCRRPLPPGNLYLVGYRCTGKTSIGLRLAQRLNRVFVDCDQRVTTTAGMTVTDIVSREGWAGFRQRECRVLKDIARTENRVVATGGGIVGDVANRWNMRRSGIVVWLTASVPVIAARMTADPITGDQRPALSQAPLEKEIVQTLTARIPLYANTAHFHVITDNRSFEGICDEILHRLTARIARCEKRFEPRRSLRLCARTRFGLRQSRAMP
ncbi:MAG: shikimate kinase AroL [Pseudomonadota bacterium]